MNKDMKRRDEILGISSEYLGGTAHYKPISLDVLEQLIKEDFVNLDECQNSSPSINEFLEFMKENPKVKAHGYVVHSDRSDYRLSIEGLWVDEEDVTNELKITFMEWNRFADEFNVKDNLRSWWD